MEKFQKDSLSIITIIREPVIPLQSEISDGSEKAKRQEPALQISVLDEYPPEDTSKHLTRRQIDQIRADRDRFWWRVKQQMKQ
ncbi:MAG: hypothetical protein J1E79_03685 [Rikenella sp.]|nr:hypothetical protein [Rikenella sp.]